MLVTSAALTCTRWHRDVDVRLQPDRCGADGSPPKQAVVETTAGTFIIDLTPETAPNQTAYFMKTAAEGGYDGTIFHRMIPRGMVQGGDPLSKDPSKREAYGSGGLNAVKDDPRAPKMTRGSVAAVTVPGKPDSAGAQFFIVLADQPALDGKYTVFGQVSDGMEVLLKISTTPVDAGGLATERVEIRRVTIRDTPPEPFVTETAAGARRLQGGARHERGADHHRVFHRQGARHGPSVHAHGGRRRVQRHGISSGGARLRHSDRRGGHPRLRVHGEAAEARPAARSGVQRHEAREGDRVDGARVGAGKRDDVVLYLHRHRRRRSTVSTPRSAG